MPVLDFSADVFKSRISKKETLVVTCYAPWCHPCRALAPLVEELSGRSDVAHVTFLKIDIEEQEKLAAPMDVSAIPTVIFYRGGKEYDRVVGGDFDAIEKMAVKCFTSLK
jgi:thioredoxin